MQSVTLPADSSHGYVIHHCFLYSNVGWPSLALVFCSYKVLIGKLPLYSIMMMVWHVGPDQTRSNDWLVLRVPWTCSHLGESAFSFSAPNWCSNHQHTLKIDTLPTNAQFKTTITNHCMLSMCYCFSYSFVWFPQLLSLYFILLCYCF